MKCKNCGSGKMKHGGADEDYEYYMCQDCGKTLCVPVAKTVNLMPWLDGNLPSGVEKGNVIYYWKPTEQDRQDEFEDMADEYLIEVLEEASCGIVVHAKFRDEWMPNPHNYRSIIRQLLIELGKFSI